MSLKVGIYCHPVFILGTARYRCSTLELKGGGANVRGKTSGHRSMEGGGAAHLFLLVLALGAMSGVRTYRLLFLGRCKLLSGV